MLDITTNISGLLKKKKKHMELSSVYCLLVCCPAWTHAEPRATWSLPQLQSRFPRRCSVRMAGTSVSPTFNVKGSTHTKNFKDQNLDHSVKLKIQQKLLEFSLQLYRLLQKQTFLSKCFPHRHMLSEWACFMSCLRPSL